MITIYHSDLKVTRQLTLPEFAKLWHQQAEGYYWIDLENPNEAEDETVLISLFQVHSLTIEDTQAGRDAEQHLPKVEDFNEYLFIIFNPLRSENARTGNGRSEAIRSLDLKTSQLSAYLYKNALITHHYEPMSSITGAQRLCEKNSLFLSRGPDYLFHIIIDTIVDNYNPILDALDDAIDTMEDEIFHSPAQETMSSIMRLKRDVMLVRRIAFYQREMLNRLSRGEFDLITEREVIYYRNVYDHLIRMSDLAESYRDVISGLLESYLSVTSNNLNQVMKVLTIISTIFLPLSVLTGFWGMNFKVLPFAESEYGYFAATGIMILVAFFMLWYFRRKRWM